MWTWPFCPYHIHVWLDPCMLCFVKGLFQNQVCKFFETFMFMVPLLYVFGTYQQNMHVMSEWVPNINMQTIENMKGWGVLVQTGTYNIQGVGKARVYSHTIFSIKAWPKFAAKFFHYRRPVSFATVAKCCWHVWVDYVSLGQSENEMHQTWRWRRWWRWLHESG